MFETTTTDGGITVVRVSFWQCVKAGFAFGLGAAFISGVAGVLNIAVFLAMIGELLKAIAHR